MVQYSSKPLSNHVVGADVFILVFPEMVTIFEVTATPSIFIKDSVPVLNVLLAMVVFSNSQSWMVNRNTKFNIQKILMRPCLEKQPDASFSFHLREVSTARIDTTYEDELWLFGNTQERHSVAVRVLGFIPYFLIDRPNQDPEEWRTELNDDLRGDHKFRPDVILKVVEEDRLRAVPGDVENTKIPLLKVYYKNYAELRKIREHIQNTPYGGKHLKLYHDDWSLESLFLLETNTKMQSWITIDKSTAPRQHEIARNVTGRLHTTCQIERYVCYENVHESPEQPTVIPLLICALRKKAISAASTKDNIQYPNADNKEDCIKVITCDYYWLGETEPIHRIYQGPEMDILQGFFADVKLFDVDCFVMLTDNSPMLQYIAKRALSLPLASKFSKFDNDLVKASRRAASRKPSENAGSELVHYVHFNTWHLNTVGRSVLNMQDAMKKMQIKPVLEGYTLKHAVFHPVINNTDVDNTAFNAYSYCNFQTQEELCRDAQQELRWIRTIEQNNKMMLEYIGYSAACFASITNMVSRGQQPRVMNKFHETFVEEHLLKNKEMLDRTPLILQMKREDSSYPNPVDLPNVTLEERRQTKRKRERVDLFGRRINPKKKKKATPKRFSGGHVCEPIKNAYTNKREPTIIHDFASLYPSIIQGYNVCYMRLIYDKLLFETKYKDDPRYEKEYVPINDNECIVLIKSVDGVPTRTWLPQTTAKVCQERKRVRALMKQKGLSEFEYNCLNAKQLACKVFQNALYGFLGVREGSNPLFACPVLMAMVCCIGQFMIKTAKYILISHFFACIVYGDTDSLMSQFPVPDHLTTWEEVWDYLFELGFEIQKHFSTVFPAPNLFEFEAVKFPFFLFNKKNYASLQYMSGDDWRTVLPGLNVSGLNFKKRDKCPLVREIGTFVMNALLRHDLEPIIPYLRDKCDKLVSGKIPLKELCITCLLQPDHEYKLEDLIQRVTARKIAERTGKITEAGSRLEYIVMTARHLLNAKQCDRGDSLEYIRDTPGVSPDLMYYLTSQLQPPIETLFMHSPELLKEFKSIIARATQKAKRTRDGVSALRIPTKKHPTEKPTPPQKKQMLAGPTKKRKFGEQASIPQKKQKSAALTSTKKRQREDNGPTHRPTKK